MTPGGAVGLEAPAKHGFGCMCVRARLCSLKVPTVYIVLLTCVAKVYLSSSGSTKGNECTHSSIKRAACVPSLLVAITHFICCMLSNGCVVMELNLPYINTSKLLIGPRSSILSTPLFEPWGSIMAADG